MTSPLFLLLSLLAASEPTPRTTPAVRAALAAKGRPKPDRDADAARKPGVVLTLAGLKPGMRAADLMAGGGYFTELLSRVVGKKGHVYSQNNAISGRVYAGAWEERLRDNRLPNTERLESELEKLPFAEASLDVVLLIQFYHDTFWMKVDRTAMNAAIWKALKPGGRFLVIDHEAAAGAGGTGSKSLHRVESALVKAELLAAGFVLEKASAALANPADAHDLSAFDPAVRGKTDQFLLIFRKPG